MKMKSICQLLVMQLFTTLGLHSQTARPFVVNNGTFTYFIGKSEPPADWKMASFDDSDWNMTDSAVIGYGWPRQLRHSPTLDSLVVEKTTSLYLRIKFDVSNPSKYRDLNFEADYNDGYIAYLNGEEIARKNVGKPGDPAPFDKLADQPHKATLYRNYYGAVNGVYIDSLVVKKLLKQGKNVFAVHVLNDSINGSDLSFRANVYNIPDCDPYYYYSETWVKYFRQVPLDSSKYPIVLINTDAYGIPMVADNLKLNIKKDVVAQMRIIDKKIGINKISDPVDFNSRISIARRGQTSKDFPKMCFSIETQDKDGENLDTALMGMPADNDWILYSAYGDKTLIRNELTFYIGRRMGHYEPRTQYCELVLNGEYQGLYIFTETIKRGKNRVSVAKRDSIHPENGGYVFKYDKNTSGVIQYVSPKPKDITENEMNYLNAFQKSFRDILKSPDFMDTVNGYRKYFSGKSLVDNVIINELTKNCDAYLFSTYFHKDKDSKDGRLKYGPLWDFDLAYCGASWQHGDLTWGWQFAEGSSSNLLVPQLFRDTALTHAYAEKWFALRQSYLSDNELFGIIDSLAANIEASRLKNYEVWPILDKQYIWPVFATYTYDDDINLIKNWLTQRMKWIDDNINLIYYPIKTETTTLVSNNSLFEVYPSPFTNHVTLKFAAGAGTYNISIRGVDGKTICKKQVTCMENEVGEVRFSSELGAVKSGIFFAIISKNGTIVQARKIVKTSAN